jgi:hypothetical protein
MQSSGMISSCQPPLGVLPRKPAVRMSRIFIAIPSKEIYHSDPEAVWCIALRQQKKFIKNLH